MFTCEHESLYPNPAYKYSPSHTTRSTYKHTNPHPRTATPTHEATGRVHARARSLPAQWRAQNTHELLNRLTHEPAPPCPRDNMLLTCSMASARDWLRVRGPALLGGSSSSSSSTLTLVALRLSRSEVHTHRGEEGGREGGRGEGREEGRRGGGEEGGRKEGFGVTFWMKGWLSCEKKRKEKKRNQLCLWVLSHERRHQPHTQREQAFTTTHLSCPLHIRYMSAISQINPTPRDEKPSPPHICRFKEQRRKKFSRTDP